jgi:hypothetical protein
VTMRRKIPQGTVLSVRHHPHHCCCHYHHHLRRFLATTVAPAKESYWSQWNHYKHHHDLNSNKNPFIISRSLSSSSSCWDVSMRQPILFYCHPSPKITIHPISMKNHNIYYDRRMLNPWRQQPLKHHLQGKQQIRYVTNRNISDFDSLMQSTRHILSLSSSSSSTVSTCSDKSFKGPSEKDNIHLVTTLLEDMILQWHSFLTANIRHSSDNNGGSSSSNRSIGIDMIKELYQSWISHIRGGFVMSTSSLSLSTPRTNENPINTHNSTNHTYNHTHNRSSDKVTNSIIKPFQIMLELYTNLIPNHGYEALQILHDWYSLYHGDIQLSPTKDQYEHVLLSYLNIQPPSSFIDNNHHDRNDIEYQYYRNIDEGAQVAIEIRDQLQQWGYAMEPDIRTYLLIIQCISNAIIHMTLSSTNPTKHSKLCQYVLHSQSDDANESSKINKINNSLSTIIANKLLSLNHGINTSMDHFIRHIIKQHSNSNSVYVGKAFPMSTTINPRKDNNPMSFVLPDHVVRELRHSELANLLLGISHVLQCNNYCISYQNINQLSSVDMDDIKTLVDRRRNNHLNHNTIKWQNVWAQLQLHLSNSTTATSTATSNISSQQNRKSLFRGIQRTLFLSSSPYQQDQLLKKYDVASIDDLDSFRLVADFFDQTNYHYLMGYRNMTATLLPTSWWHEKERPQSTYSKKETAFFEYSAFDDVAEEISSTLSCAETLFSDFSHVDMKSIPSLIHYNQAITILKNIRRQYHHLYHDTMRTKTDPSHSENDPKNNPTVGYKRIEQQQMQYLHDMNRLYYETLDEDDATKFATPTTLTLYTNLLMKSYLDCNQPNHVINIWDDMKKRRSSSSTTSDTKYVNIRRDVTSYGIVLEALASEHCSNAPTNTFPDLRTSTTKNHPYNWKETSHSRALKAHSIWKTMLSIFYAQQKSNNADMTTTSIALDSTLHGIDPIDVVIFARYPTIISSIGDNCFNESTFVPNSKHYATVMRAWSRSYHPSAAVYCQEVYDQLNRDAELYSSFIGPPDIRHDKAFITTLGYSTIPGCYERILELYDKYHGHYHRDYHHYTAKLALQSQPFEERSDDIESNMELSETILYALSQLTKNKKGAIEAECMFEQILEDKKMLLQQRRVRSGDIREAGNTQQFRPLLTTKCYNSVMMAWVKANEKDSSMHCETIFKKLQDAYQESNYHPDVQPDSFSYVALIESYIKSFSHCNGTTPSFDVGAKASEILADMERRAQSNLCEYPDVNVYSAVMKAYWKQGDGNAIENVEAVLNRMKYSYENLHNIKAKPDTHAMTILLHTWAKSKHPDKASMAYKVLHSMIESYQQGDMNMKPTTHSFAAVLNACAFMETYDDKEKQAETIQIALSCMNLLQNASDDEQNYVYGQPNEFIYKNLFQTICRNLLDTQERSRIASIIFQRCCQDGYVTKSVINILRKHIPDLYKKLPLQENYKRSRSNDKSRTTTNHDVIRQLPKEWTRSIVEN